MPWKNEAFLENLKLAPWEFISPWWNLIHHDIYSGCFDFALVPWAHSAFFLDSVVMKCDLKNYLKAKAAF